MPNWSRGYSACQERGAACFLEHIHPAWTPRGASSCQRIRDELSAGLVLTRGQERCLYVFPVAEFERIHETMRSSPLPGRQARDFMRMFLSGASDEVPG